MVAPRRSNFLKDKAEGDRGEDLVLSLLEAYGLKAGKNPAETKAGKTQYDLWVDLPHGRVTAEVKSDLREAKSGNVAVEYYNPRSNKPSGLSATVAELWIFCLADGSVWICRTSDLRRHHLKGPGGEGYVRDLPRCGDGNSSSTLFRRTLLFDVWFFQLDHLEAVEAVSLLEVLTVAHAINSDIIDS